MYKPRSCNGDDRDDDDQKTVVTTSSRIRGILQSSVLTSISASLSLLSLSLSLHPFPYFPLLLCPSLNPSTEVWGAL